MRALGPLLLACIACASAQVHLKAKLLYRFTDGENGGQPLGESAACCAFAARPSPPRCKAQSRKQRG